MLALMVRDKRERCERGKQFPNKEEDYGRLGRWHRLGFGVHSSSPSLLTLHPPSWPLCTIFSRFNDALIPPALYHSHLLAPSHFRQAGANTPLRIHF